jgi:CDP-diacylglycerol---glycerol-3-phosphate 3-phosphatidyltransferase
MKQQTKYLIVQIITGLRVPLAIIIYLVLDNHESAQINFQVVLTLLVLMELSDIMDGFLARRWGAVSAFGKYFDPLCDSIARLMVFLGLWQIKLVPIWLIIVIVVRDMILTFLYLLYYSETKQIYESRMSSKIKAIVQGFGAILLVIVALLNNASPVSMETIKPFVVWFIAVVTLLSLADYTKIVLTRALSKSSPVQNGQNNLK